MKVFKKVILMLVVLAAASLAWADEKSDLIKLVENSPAYYVGERNGNLMKMVVEGNCLTRISYEVNFLSNTMRSGSISSTTLYEKSVKEFLNGMESRNGKITSFEDWDDLYLPVPANFRTEDQILVYYKGMLNKKFDRCTGTYTESKTGRIYSIERQGSDYKITIKYPKENLADVTDVLKIMSYCSLGGEKTGIFFYASDQSSKFRISDPNPSDLDVHDEVDCRCGDEDSDEYHSVSFVPQAYVNKDGVAEVIDRQIEFVAYEFLFSEEVNKRLFFDENYAWIGKYNGAKRNYDEELSIRAYKTYLDANGWKCAEVGDRKFMFIDGNDLNFAFAYRGKSLAEDKTAIGYEMKELGSKEEGWINTGNGANGIGLVNPKASSTLKDKSHVYSVYGTLNLFVMNGKRTWTKNNVPWVEAAAGDGIGESIEYDISVTPMRGRVGYKMYILNGYVDPLRPYLFKQNNRVKKLLVETDSGFSQMVEFNDAVEFTEIKFPLESTHVKLTIKEVYKGSKYEDTCISGVMLGDEMWER